MKKQAVILSVLVLLISCGKSGSTWTYEHASAPGLENTKYQLYDLYQDSNGQKGIVVYKNVDPSTNEGSVFVLSLDETEAAWGPQDKEVYPIPDKDLKELILTPGYTLSINHMVNRLGRDNYPAFAWCQDKNPDDSPLNGESWILPGIWEWLVLLKSIDTDLLNDALVLNGGTKLAGEEEYYWTASEDQEGVITFDDNNPELEANLDFNPRERAVHISSEGKLLINKVYWSKSIRYHVRAVKFIYCYKPYHKGE